MKVLTSSLVPSALAASSHGPSSQWESEQSKVSISSKRSVSFLPSDLWHDTKKMIVLRACNCYFKGKGEEKVSKEGSISFILCSMAHQVHDDMGQCELTPWIHYSCKIQQRPISGVASFVETDWAQNWKLQILQEKWRKSTKSTHQFVYFKLNRLICS